VQNLPVRYSSGSRRVILQIFCYMLVFISYKEQIQSLKSFKTVVSIIVTIIVVEMELMMDKEFVCSASFKICLVVCLLHWSLLQIGSSNTFNSSQLKKIHEYAIFCEENIFKSEVTNIRTCLYGLSKMWDARK